jgi:hypothetical protein
VKVGFQLFAGMARLKDKITASVVVDLGTQASES